MTDALMIVTFLLAGIFGWWIMGWVDRRLDEHARSEEEEADEQRQE